MRTSFHHQPEAQHPIFHYLQAGRPITPILLEIKRTADELLLRRDMQQGRNLSCRLRSLMRRGLWRVSAI
jgi:hypothetical protein